MGINTLFTQRAQLPYLSDDAVQVTNAEQQASLDVNEEGTILVAFSTVHVVALSFQVKLAVLKSCFLLKTDHKLFTAAASRGYIYGG